MLRIGTPVRLEDPSLPEHCQPTGTIIGADYLNKVVEVRWDHRYASTERILPACVLVPRGEK